MRAVDLLMKKNKREIQEKLKKEILG